MSQVITIGGIVYDIFIKTSSVKILKRGKEAPFLCFNLGTKIVAKDVFFSTGGGGGNTACALKKLSIDCVPLGVISNDNMGKTVIKEFDRKKIDTSLIQITKKAGLKTALSIILSDPLGERTVFTYRGVSDFLCKAYLKKGALQKAQWIFISHLSGRSNRVIKDLLQFKKDHPRIKIAWNPGATELKENWKEGSLMSRFVKVTDCFIVNREEAVEILGKKFEKRNFQSLTQALSFLGSKITVITDGKKGAFARFENKFFKTPSYPVKEVSTLGAGDAFSAAFLASIIINGEDIKKALHWGVLNGAGVVREFGAQNGLLTRNEIIEKERKWVKS